ncbi:plasmid replication, integration and excision activator [Nocardioides sp. NBC_00850]|uniref:plasmid replication, integration and excision activator n=1 Tax=Nocardioides sp. NBC_00850 TaxID=2976001 RepID=UPI003868BACF|nr:plasmid replication, integration and excision activator [Nocardioides sp. NBC_00850]
MAMPQKMQMTTEQFFPNGAFVVGDVTPVADFDAPAPAKGQPRPQKRDQDTGLLVWTVPVLDTDPNAKKHQKTVNVKILDKVQPVPPRNDTGLPIIPVEFTELEVGYYVKREGDFSRIEWTLTALGMTEPGAGRKPAANGGAAGSKAAA